ncbi:MAG: hypothetical protein SFU86_15945, partial [Pirellulaceae bacterium]|nr:hypothetical protein [Pirellulaceae bacterium]
AFTVLAGMLPSPAPWWSLPHLCRARHRGEGSVRGPLAFPKSTTVLLLGTAYVGPCVSRHAAICEAKDGINVVKSINAIETTTTVMTTVIAILTLIG